MPRKKMTKKERMIAAAPTMLKALKWAIDLADRNEPHFDGRTGECKRCYNACKSAIAKATR